MRHHPRAWSPVLVVRGVLLSLLLTLLPVLPVVQAQDHIEEDRLEKTPFSSLRVGLSGGLTFRDRGMSSWTPGPDVRLTVDTPYGHGRLRLDLTWQDWSGMDQVSGLIDVEGRRFEGNLPDVRTFGVLAGWGWSNKDDAAILLETGWMLGNQFMLFDLPSTSAGRFESEIQTGPWFRVGRVLGPVRLFSEVRAVRMLTRPRWDQVVVSGGLSWEMSTPGWIRWVLQ